MERCQHRHAPHFCLCTPLSAWRARTWRRKHSVAAPNIGACVSHHGTRHEILQRNRNTEALQHVSGMASIMSVNFVHTIQLSSEVVVFNHAVAEPAQLPRGSDAPRGASTITEQILCRGLLPSLVRLLHVPNWIRGMYQTQRELYALFFSGLVGFCVIVVTARPGITDAIGGVATRRRVKVRVKIHRWALAGMWSRSYQGYRLRSW